MLLLLMDLLIASILISVIPLLQLMLFLLVHAQLLLLHLCHAIQ